MREHGVLKRILLVYAEALRRFDAREPMPAQPLADAANIIRTFRARPTAPLRPVMSDMCRIMINTS
jgi:hypothetical protein